MARILITGGAGYVGSHCAKALAAADMKDRLRQPTVRPSRVRSLGRR